ncbi:HK97 family phage prohead protease, partial [Streptococcus suis]
VSFNRPVVEWHDGDAGKVRMIMSARLLEVSVCRHPAYRSSEIHAGKLRIERFTSTLPDPRFERLEAAEAAMAKYRKTA